MIVYTPTDKEIRQALIRANRVMAEQGIPNRRWHRSLLQKAGVQPTSWPKTWGRVRRHLGRKIYWASPSFMRKQWYRVALACILGIENYF